MTTAKDAPSLGLDVCGHEATGWGPPSHPYTPASARPWLSLQHFRPFCFMVAPVAAAAGRSGAIFEGRTPRNVLDCATELRYSVSTNPFPWSVDAYE